MYFRDTGLLHALLGINNYDVLSGHPKLGASFEGFAMEQVIRLYNADRESCFFWRTQNGAELDLIILQNGRVTGFEFKYTAKPSMSKSLRSALKDISPDKIFVITPGQDSYPIHENVRVCGLDKYCGEI